MSELLVDILKCIQILRLLNADEINQLATQVKLVELESEEILFEQFSEPSSVYILIKGEVIAYLVTDNKIKYITSGLPQEIVGEMSALSNQPRSISIKAACQSELIEIPTNYFIALCKTHPDILFEITTTIIHRSQNTISLVGKSLSTEFIYIFPGNNIVSYDHFKTKLENNIDKEDDILFCDIQNQNIDKTYKYILDLRGKRKTVIIFVNKPIPEVFKKVFNIINGKVYFVVNATDKNYEYSAAIEEIHEFLVTQKNSNPYLILMHPDSCNRPTGTINWLKKYAMNQHHHIRINDYKDYQRLIRFFSGKATGLVMSGGGTKVIAHVGALKAIEEENIVIDAFGGTSGGALVTAGYLLHWPYENFLKYFLQGQRSAYKTFSSRGITFPLISLFSGYMLTLALQTIFSEINIEDLWLPFFCITSNLTKMNQEIHTSGTLWKILRGSVAIPGLLSPMLLDGDLHYDGALVNNLPVDVMKLICGLQGTVIASYLMPINERYLKIYNFPPILTLKESLLLKLRLTSKKHTYPPFFETLLNALLLGTHEKELRNCLAADILINPDLSQYSFIQSFDSETELKLIDKGYTETLKIINDHKRLFTFCR